jgi:hypothetical protein
VGPYSETYPASYDADQAMNIEVKEGSDVEVEDDPVPISYLEIKAEPEVSCMCTVRQITQMYRSVFCLNEMHPVVLCTIYYFYSVKTQQALSYIFISVLHVLAHLSHLQVHVSIY